MWLESFNIVVSLSNVFFDNKVFFHLPLLPKRKQDSDVLLRLIDWTEREKVDEKMSWHLYEKEKERESVCKRVEIERDRLG